MDSHEYCNEQHEQALTERDAAREQVRTYTSRYHKLAMEYAELERRYDLLTQHARALSDLLREFAAIDQSED